MKTIVDLRISENLKTVNGNELLELIVENAARLGKLKIVTLGSALDDLDNFKFP
jgi:hypothetical protein